MSMAAKQGQVIIVEKRKTYLPHFLAIACLWLLAQNMDYAEEAAMSQESFERVNAEFTACQRGEWRAVTEQGVELGCMPIEQLRPEDKRKST